MKSPIQREAEKRLRPVMQIVEAGMPPGMGIAIFVFEHDTDKGNIGYIANARREDMRRCLTEFLAKWEADAAGQPFMPLTLEAFEAWVRAQFRDDVVAVIERYQELSNSGPTNPQEVSQQ